MDWGNTEELDQQLITIQDLAYSCNEEKVSQLIPFLYSDEPRACWAATWALDRCWNDRATEPIAHTIQRVDVYAPVLAHMKGTSALYSLLEFLEPEENDWESDRRAWRIAKALTHAYDDKVETALLKMLATGPHGVGDRAIAPLLAQASGAVLENAVDLSLHRYPYQHTFYQASKTPRPGLANCFVRHLQDKDPKVRETARKLVNQFEKIADSGLDPAEHDPGVSKPGVPRVNNTNLYNLDQIWGNLKKPGETDSAIKAIRNLLTLDSERLSTENLRFICGMRDTYLYRYEWFPAGYEYEPLFEIKALNVEGIQQLAQDEMALRGECG